MINLDEFAVELDYTYGFGIPSEMAKDMEKYEYILLKDILNYDDFFLSVDRIEPYKEPKNGAIDCSEWHVDPEEGFALRIDYDKPKN